MIRRTLATLLLVATAACGSATDAAVNEVIEQVRLGDPLAQRNYAENKELLESAEAVPRWVDALATHESPAVQKWAAQMLGNIKDPTTIAALTSALGSSREVRDAAAAAIGGFSEEEAIDAYIAAVESDDRDAQTTALSLISRLPLPAAVPAVAGLARAGGLVGKQAINTLGDIGDATAAEQLAQIALDGALEGDVRAAALQTLGRIEGDAASGQLDSLVESLDAASDEASAELLETARGLQGSR